MIQPVRRGIVCLTALRPVPNVTWPPGSRSSSRRAGSPTSSMIGSTAAGGTTLSRSAIALSTLPRASASSTLRSPTPDRPGHQHVACGRAPRRARGRSRPGTARGRATTAPSPGSPRRTRRSRGSRAASPSARPRSSAPACRSRCRARPRARCRCRRRAPRHSAGRRAGTPTIAPISSKSIGVAIRIRLRTGASSWPRGVQRGEDAAEAVAHQRHLVAAALAPHGRDGARQVPVDVALEVVVGVELVRHAPVEHEHVEPGAVRYSTRLLPGRRSRM